MFTFSCVFGFAGPKCEVDIDECVGQPCENNKICKQLDGSFECLCPEGKWMLIEDYTKYR